MIFYEFCLIHFVCVEFVAAVQNVQVEVVTTTSVKVTWNNSDFQGITNFVVYYRQTGNTMRQFDEMNIVVPVSSNSVTIDNLEYGGVYVFEVVARVTLGDESVEGSRAGPGSLIISTTLLAVDPQQCTLSSSHSELYIQYTIWLNIK